jgi:GntR family transcriptional regulator
MYRHISPSAATFERDVMESPQARYLEIAAHLRGLVSDAEPGDLLPSDAELCQEFDVSRMTARQAVQLLVNEHLVERRRGRGTFVAPRRIPRALGSPLSFTESMRQRGRKASSRSIESRVANADETEARALGIEAGDPVYVIERVRLVDDVPMAIERVVLPTSVAAVVDMVLMSGSLHEAFAASGLHPSKAHAEVSARLATEWEQEQLDMTAVSVVLAEERTIFDQDDRPLEHTVTFYAADRYSFSAVLVPDSSDTST